MTNKQTPEWAMEAENEIEIFTRSLAAQEDSRVPRFGEVAQIIADHAPKQEWIKTSDQPPKAYTWFLVVDADERQFLALYNPDLRIWHISNSGTGYTRPSRYFTHYMLLPDPPKEE